MSCFARDIKTKEKLMVNDSRIVDGEYKIYCQNINKEDVTKKRSELIFKLDLDFLKRLRAVDISQLTEIQKQRHYKAINRIANRLNLSIIQLYNLDLDEYKL